VAAVLILGGCGRLDIGRPDGVVRFSMDDDPIGGRAYAEPPTFSATCEICPVHEAGYRRGGYHFDGTQHLELPTGHLVGAAPYTVSIWANPDDTGVYMTTMSKPFSTTDTSDVLNLLIGPDGIVQMETTPGNGNLDYLVGTTSVVGGWHHIVATWDGTTKRIYIDGVLDGTEDATVVDSDALPILIGKDKDGEKFLSPFAGVLDELVIYDHALSSGEIAAMK